MSSDRRDFLKQSLLAGAALAIKPSHLFSQATTTILTDMELRFYPYTLELKHTFTIATSSRTTTPTMMVEVERDGIIGYGEASMPPYLGESQETAKAFLSKVNLKRYESFFSLEDILGDIDAIAIGNHAAKAAVDIALHDWMGKKMGYAWHQYLLVCLQDMNRSSLLKTY